MIAYDLVRDATPTVDAEARLLHSTANTKNQYEAYRIAAQKLEPAHTEACTRRLVFPARLASRLQFFDPFANCTCTMSGKFIAPGYIFYVLRRSKLAP